MFCLDISLAFVLMLVQNDVFFCLIQALKHGVNCYYPNYKQTLLLDRFGDALFLFASTQKNKMIRSNHFIVQWIKARASKKNESLNCLHPFSYAVTSYRATLGTKCEK